MQYFVSFLVLQLSRCGRESWLFDLLSSGCHVAVIVLCLFLKVPLVRPWCVVVVIPGELTYFLTIHGKCSCSRNVVFSVIKTVTQWFHTNILESHP